MPVEGASLPAPQRARQAQRAAPLPSLLPFFVGHLVREAGDDAGVTRRAGHGAQRPEAVGALLGHEAGAGLAQVEDAGHASLDEVGHGRRQLPPRLTVAVVVFPDRRAAPPELIGKRHEHPARLSGDLAPQVEELGGQRRPPERLDECARGIEVAGRAGRQDATREEPLGVDQRGQPGVPSVRAGGRHPRRYAGHERVELAGRGYRHGPPA